MAHKTSKGSTDLGRDSRSKRLGVKVFGNQAVSKGEIIVRQRGTKYHPGTNVRKGSDDTLYATTSGTVKFKHKQLRGFHGNLKDSRIVSVEAK